LLTLLALAACTGTKPSISDNPPPPVRPVAYTPTAIPFARRRDGATIEVPPSSRPNGEAAPDRFHPAGTFSFDKRVRGNEVYKIPLPVHSDLFPMRERGTHIFGNDAPPGLHVYLDGGELQQIRFAKAPGQYGFDRDYLYIAIASGDPAPTADRVEIAFDRATLMENSLNQASSGLSNVDFALRNITVDERSYTGLLLPAPATAKWLVTVPSNGIIGGRATVLSPAIYSEQESDGASLVVEVTADGATTEVGRVPVRLDDWQDLHLDLSKWANQTVTVAFRTEPGATPTFDYVFVEEPTLYTPSEHPRRLVLVFVDTLRPDHLGMYGYPRPTTPKLDKWAEHAAIFENARTVAPWTLPSARAILTGAQPEMWFETPNLPTRLANAGFQTEAFVTNAYISQAFDMHAGWGRYSYLMEKSAVELVPMAIREINDHPDRDLALLVHLMETHIPYDEPPGYQGLFAGPKPPPLDEVSRRELRKIPPGSDGFDAVKQYVIDRYDQNLRVVDDTVADLVAAAGPDATIIFFADHGEEFWDHGEFEHGQSLYEELLHVPLVVRSPNVPAGRVKAPVSLLDLTPTALELMGLPHDATDGRSLLPVLWGDPGAAEALAARPQAFGRPLYDPSGNSPTLDGWGVYLDGHKWWQRGGEQHVYDVTTDPGETKDLAGSGDLTSWPKAMATALQREVVPVWRVVVRNGRNIAKSQLTVSAPGGIAPAWNSYDPRGEYAATQPSVDSNGVAHLTQEEGNPIPPSIYLRPKGDPHDVAGLDIQLTAGNLTAGAHLVGPAEVGPPAASPGYAVVPAPASVDFSASGKPFLEVGNVGWGATVDLVWVAVPKGVAVSGYSPDVAQELKELGYVIEE
jgi:arylsulfatase